MQMLENIPGKKHKKRIGRGGKRGTYSGRGVKGQRARAGTRHFNSQKDEVKAYPKLRGGHFHSRKTPAVAINVSALERFEPKSAITAQTLVDAGIIRKGDTVKLLGSGELTKALTVSGIPMSQTAKTKIEKAGGTVS